MPPIESPRYLAKRPIFLPPPFSKSVSSVPTSETLVDNVARRLKKVLEESTSLEVPFGSTHVPANVDILTASVVNFLRG